MTSGITPVNAAALDAAREIWLPMPPEEMEATRDDQEAPPPWPSFADFTHDVVEAFGAGRRVVRFPPAIWRSVREQLRENGAETFKSASTGAVVLAYILKAYPRSRVDLYGFTHEGWAGHPWEAEAKWMRSFSRVDIKL